ncbi:hypothetical protein T265_04762 [Opisthorchis viverrini]|uniref:Uncharacterized protein n=1 Tax=Opisthorchis viverrini TaxID=6198 RepID=A0A074ZRC6_OPIVI|nr:hypothetical protein T265_04762 [Opisthorchis viverrini]KER28377.1 hypothetical protein T265_04762 [Opisthorchis viverrini]
MPGGTIMNLERWFGKPGSIPALVLPSGGMAVRHQKGAKLNDDMNVATSAHVDIPMDKNRLAAVPSRCLTTMPPKGSTRAGIPPGCPSLDRGRRKAEVRFEPRTFPPEISGAEMLPGRSLTDNEYVNDNAPLVQILPECRRS